MMANLSNKCMLLLLKKMYLTKRRYLEYKYLIKIIKLITSYFSILAWI